MGGKTARGKTKRKGCVKKDVVSKADPVENGDLGSREEQPEERRTLKEK